MLATAVALAATAAVGSCSTTAGGTAPGHGGPRAADGYRLDKVVTGNDLHSINGVALGQDGRVVATSLASETVTEIDPATAAVTPLVGSPEGRSDDLVVTPTGEVLWTDPVGGVVRRRERDGSVRTIIDDLSGVNSIAYDRARQHLYVGQTSRGDGLWEIDPTGTTPKRQVAGLIGQPNAFAFGPDGQIYAPSAPNRSVLRIDPGSGAVTRIADGFKLPVSVRFDSHDRLYVLDGGTGDLVRVDPVTGAKQTVVTLPAADDNMIIRPGDHAFVSNMADSSLVDVDLATGTQRVVTRSVLTFPADVAAAPDGVVVADETALRVVDPASGQVRELARRLATDIQFPTGVSVHGDHLVVTSALNGSIQLLDRTGRSLRLVTGFAQPADAVELADGALVVAEPSGGRLVRVDGAAPPRPLAEGLGAPSGVEVARDGQLLVTDAAGGRLLDVDPTTGTVSVVATGLGAPRGVAVAPDGTLVVLDGRGRVLRLGADGSNPATLADGLPVGYLATPYPRTGGTTVAADGTVYIAADKENSLYALRPL